MQTRNVKLLNPLLGLLLLAHLTGCAAAVVGGAAAAATYVYENGWLEYTYDAGLDRSYRASLEALRDQGVRLTRQDKALADAELEGLYNDQQVWVDLEAVNDYQTVIGVRVTIMGDREASRRIHDAIARRL